MSGTAQDKVEAQRRGGAHVAVGAAVFALALLAGLGLWAQFGEAVYLDRILTAIANCF